jgi:hypothetical protein
MAILYSSTFFIIIHLVDIFEQQGGQLHLAQQGQSPET